LIKAGYSKETLASQSSLITLFSLAFTFTIMKFNIKNKEITFIKYSMGVTFFIGILEYFILFAF
jgi:hypothetical protein